MQADFFKFPRTPHLFWPLDRPPKDDRVLDDKDARAVLSGDVVVEEKLDGANIGISVGPSGEIRVQNRGAWLEPGSHPQFHPLWSWVGQRRPALKQALGNNYILFGEWCFATHSTAYDSLPDWFLGFDVYDISHRRFWSTTRRNRFLACLSISPVPELSTGLITADELCDMLRSQLSRFGHGPMEGLYVRRESEEWLEFRAKLVRAEFLCAIDEHWSSKPLQRNRLRSLKQPIADAIEQVKP